MNSEHNRICRVCGAGFTVDESKRGRRSEYDTPECRRVAARMTELQTLFAWLKNTHGITNEAAQVLYSESFLHANLINPRGKHKSDPGGKL